MNKSQLERKCLDILYHTERGCSISSAAKEFVLTHILPRHPRASSKVGVGVENIYVKTGPAGHPFFWILRLDGSGTDFSYKKCLANPKSWKRSALSKALRLAVTDDVMRFKTECFGDSEVVRCAMTGEIVRKDNCHVDHESPTFSEIMQDWLSANHLLEEEIPLVGDEDGAMFAKLADAELADDFRQYHLANAKLRVVSIAANLSRPRSRKRCV